MRCLLYCSLRLCGLTEVLHVQHQVKLLHWDAWHSLSCICPDLPSLECTKVFLGALLLSTVAGRVCASLLNSGSSRFPSSGYAPIENTPALGNKGKINQRCTTPPTAQVGLPTSTAGIQPSGLTRQSRRLTQPSRLTQSISAIDIAIKACTQASGLPF